MSGTTVTGVSYTTDDDPVNKGGISYILGLTLAILVLLITLSYASYKCSRNLRSSSPLPEGDHHQLVTGRGIDDDVLVTFPAFIYSERKLGDSAAADGVNCSVCSVCLADYKQADVVRLLPECGHLFHVSCIDTWLKVHPSCPVCRNSPLPVKLSIQRS